ncbi:3-oxoacyl-[acyl-carrier-protein] synthase III C-terminal domain-containing protein [Embleya sp. NPDC056575]|uniref:3-oxoacyl-[acyl-carrier-protein] synthase III C-terminal domain-containing protein n=1 Tax=unclassified Embleya TaxID=2699296 RepID=UPI003686F15F
MLWQDITIAGTGAWIPPIVPVPDPRDAPVVEPRPATLNGFTSAAIATDHTPTHMAARAGLKALRHADVAPADLSALVHANFQDEDHYTPGTYLLRVLGGAHTVGYELCAASDGGAAALVAAAEHLTARPAAKAALVTAGARFPEQRWGGAREMGYVAGDTGAAAVLTRGTGFARLAATAQAVEPRLEVLTRARTGHPGGGRPFPIEDSGLMPHMDTLQRATRRCVETVLDETDTKPGDVTHVVAIAIGSIVLDLVLAGSPLDLRCEDTSWTFGRHLGHAGPCDILLGLDRLFRSGTARAGDRVLVLSFGLGFRWTTALIEVTRDTNPAAPAARTHPE